MCLKILVLAIGVLAVRRIKFNAFGVGLGIKQAFSTPNLGSRYLYKVLLVTLSFSLMTNSPDSSSNFRWIDIEVCVSVVVIIIVVSVAVIFDGILLRLPIVISILLDLITDLRGAGRGYFPST